MSNEWFDIAYINGDEAILHGQIVTGHDERAVRIVLSREQIQQIDDLSFKHDQRMKKLLRGMAA